MKKALKWVTVVIVLSFIPYTEGGSQAIHLAQETGMRQTISGEAKPERGEGRTQAFTTPRELFMKLRTLVKFSRKSLLEAPAFGNKFLEIRLNWIGKRAISTRFLVFICFPDSREKFFNSYLGGRGMEYVKGLNELGSW
ncbi:hypothetical protein CDAR_579121 [Caerostris darwini]|uniref:Uncharacterized protein n=1 Tax=Caerostris darwini TaxID=1538125 RepID=A0AAV4RRF2_9ARAC|nr:hypothetical protein CDAR_579121 [Caerostris darwini]